MEVDPNLQTWKFFHNWYFNAESRSRLYSPSIIPISDLDVFPNCYIKFNAESRSRPTSRNSSLWDPCFGDSPDLLMKLIPTVCCSQAISLVWLE